MEVLKKLNQSHSQLESSNKPYYGLSKLSHGYHEIDCFRITNGKYGRSIIVELKGEIIFLPQYIVEKLNENDIEELNKFKEPLYLYFGGKHKKNK